MQLPKKISPNFIKEALVEIKFKTKLPSDAVFGALFQQLHEIIPGTLENLPILQIPLVIRDQDPNLIYKPLYKITLDNYILQIGPKVMTFSCVEEYTGWSKYREYLLKVFEKFFNLKIVDRWIDYRLRYINFFPFNILEKSNVSLTIGKSDYQTLRTQIRAEFENGDFTCALRILNNTRVFFKNNKMTGAVLDISVYKDLDKIDIQSLFGTLLNDSHRIEKQIFFDLIKAEYVKELNPEY